ncbi:MAG: hypothetical protein ACKVX7_15760 [Planctomycetota bacterium]
MPEQPVPRVSDADVERVVRRDYATDRIPEVLAMLNEYGQERWQQEPARVRLAVLRLAAGNIARLRGEIESAKCDYRDVLAPAEYPNYFKRVSGVGSLPPAEEQRIIDADWKQYQDWLKR